MKFSLRSLFYFVTAACVVAFWVGAVVQTTPIQIVAIELAVIGTPFCYLVYRNSRGSKLGRLIRTILFGCGWYWVANYLAVLSAACAREPRRDLDVYSNLFVLGWSVWMFIPSVAIVLLMVRTYLWAYHDAEFEKLISE
jgi:hypothetical protein